MDNVKMLSPSVLAFVGDAVYGLCVRERLAQINRPSGELHKLSVEWVNASAQARAYKIIETQLADEEISIFKRGRNFHTSNTPKSATGGEYHIATGLETLFGFLHLSGKYERIDELFGLIWNKEEKVKKEVPN